MEAASRVEKAASVGKGHKSKNTLFYVKTFILAANRKHEKVVCKSECGAAECNVGVPLQPEQSGEVGLIPGRAPLLERHYKEWQTQFPSYQCCEDCQISVCFQQI